MKRRNCCEVISQIIEQVPETETGLLKDLKWNFEDASYKAPEETIQWDRLFETISKHIDIPKLDWQWNVASILSTKSVEQLKEEML